MPPAKRKWGQHWLASEALAADLVAAARVAPGERILEIGPGRGRLTRALLAAGADVLAIEVDPECCRELAALSSSAPLRLIEGDVLTAEVPWDEGPFRALGNLPYNVSSPILRWTIEHREHVIDAHYMVQREVGERIVAEPGNRQYGLLSVLVQSVWVPSLVRLLAPGAFRPPPKVESAFVRLAPRPSGEIDPPECWSALAAAAFAHRRKKLLNNLLLAGHPRARVDSACAAVDIDPDLRAERLRPADFAALARALEAAS